MEGPQEESIEQIRAEVNAIQQLPKDNEMKMPDETVAPKQQEPKIPAETTPKHIEVDEADDDEDYDDEEEKDNSQGQLVMDINEEEDDEVEDLEKDDIEPNDLSQKSEQIEKSTEKDDVPNAKQSEKGMMSGQTNDNGESIITLSDAEEDLSTKPGKVQKRKSVGASSAAGNPEERYPKLKRRKINAEGAPKMPLTGYIRYMNDRRESVRKDHPTKNSIEVTKVIAEEWQGLSSDVKGEYLKAAEVDKQRYVKELHTFLKSRPDILASELAKNKTRKNENNNTNATNTAKSIPKPEKVANDTTKAAKDALKEKPVVKESQNSSSNSSQNSEKLPQQTAEKPNKRKRTPTPPYSNATTSSTSSGNAASGPSTSAAAAATGSSYSHVTPAPGEIPIFTTEFLEHNKMYDMELRSLRKSKSDLEQQNFVLEKHVENMKCGVEKMQSENNDLQEKNRLLEVYLEKLKKKLAQALGALPLPSAPNGATVENIDKYMQDLYKMSTSNSHGPATLNKAKDIIRKLDLQIQL
ncbi:high mobility group protein 20A [Stomoxys calcitrans]|uniref:high mobility group protein 20A n=1 Tax=Stomoxys calcitrans TaxID=35570 RepID=UPI0027E26D50|nr:high mobility group protein 20A [Stomoxys calcitrans]